MRNLLFIYLSLAILNILIRIEAVTGPIPATDTFLFKTQVDIMYSISGISMFMGAILPVLYFGLLDKRRIMERKEVNS